MFIEVTRIIRCLSTGLRDVEDMVGRQAAKGVHINRR